MLIMNVISWMLALSIYGCLIELIREEVRESNENKFRNSSRIKR